MANEVLVPLVYATPIAMGGLELSPLSIGRIMSAFALLNILMQIFLSARMIRYFGPRTIFITALCYLSASFLAYPLLIFLARRAGKVDGAVLAVLVFQLSCNFVLAPTFACTQIFIVDSVPSQNSLGGVNGVAQMVSSTTRALAPSFAASLFAASKTHSLLGGNLVFFVLGGIALAGVRAAVALPRRLKGE